MLTPSTSEGDGVWKQDLYRVYQVTVRSLEWALTQYDWCPYKNEKPEDIHTGRMTCEDEGRDQDDASSSQGAPTTASTPRN